MTDRIRLGSIGLGWWGGVLAEGAAKSGLAEITACYARSSESRESFANDHGCVAAASLEDLLTNHEIDGVLIATPHTSHRDLAIAAAEAGVNVFIDKPLTLTLSDADAVIAKVDENGVVLQVGHNRRRQSANRRIQEMITSGELGDVHHARAVHSAPLLFNPNLSAWRRREEEGPAGGMAALGVHQVDTLQYLLGSISRVSTVSRRLLPDGEVDDTTIVNLEFEDGALGQLVTSQATGPAVDVEVHGTEAIARNIGDGSTLTIQTRGSDERASVEIEAIDTIADELAEFAHAVRGEVTPETGAAEARSVVAVFEAIIESMETGRPVDVSSQ